MQANILVVMHPEPPFGLEVMGWLGEWSWQAGGIIDRTATCVLPNQIVAPRSHRVGPVHTGPMAAFVSSSG